MTTASAKSKEIYELTRRRYRRFKLITFFSLLSLALSFVTSLPWWTSTQMYSIEDMWSDQSLHPYIFSFACFYVAAIILILKSRAISFEKKIFLDVFDARSYLVRFDKLSGSASQQKADLDKSITLLKKASKTLLARKKRTTKSDLLAEAHERYSRLGEYIQTKILFHLKNNKVPTAIHHLRVIVNTFADVNSQKLDSCLESLEAIHEGGDFKPPLSIFESKPRLRSTLVHLGKFSTCAIVVTLVGIFFSYIFSKPLSEFAPYILTSIFVLFGSWEFKSQ